MNILKRGAIALAAVAMAGTGVGAAVAAESASAAPVVHIIRTTSLNTVTNHITPNVTLTRYTEFSPVPVAPGFVLSGNVIEVCVNIPHITPPGPLTPLELCSWKLTSTVPHVPPTSISGNAFVNGLGQVGRVTSGTGLWAGATGLPLSFRAVNLAPRVQADSWTFQTP